jgi:ABC-type uncharacterized transport system involved in gliding motility auxiliary subunit
MKKKQVETLIYSTLGVGIMLAILVAVNVLVGAVPKRVDLTQEKAYTLSAGTKEILRKMDTPVKIRFYCTQPESSTPQSLYLKNYAKKVEDLLGEYKQIAGKNLVIEKFDPQPDSDAEDSARLDGLEPQAIPGAERYYLGLSVGLADQRVSLPFLAPDRERQLEYDITRAISQLLNPVKPIIGVMSALPVWGAPGNPMMMQMGQGGQGTPPWSLLNELKADYDVKKVAMDVDKIEDEIKVLLVIHPKEITDKAQFALDQFVLRGGKLIAFVDAYSLSDRQQQNPMGGMGMGGGSSSLPALFKAWGLQFETGKVIGDLSYKMQLRGRNGQPQEAPAFLALTPEAVNPDAIALAQIDNVWLPFAGALTGTPTAGLKETVLLHSSKQAGLIDGMLASMSGESAIKDLKVAGVDYPLAVMLTGKFKTAFPAGKPEDKKDDQTDADKKDAKPEEKKADDALKESKAENSVVIFGDADLLADPFTVREVQTPFGNIAQPMNQNLPLALNLVEQLGGDSRLTSVRSRATMNRPFTRVRQMQAVAEAKFQSKIKELEDERTKAQSRLNELQQNKDKDQRFILSKEQKAEIDNLRKQEGRVAQDLKKVQKDLRKEVVSLETRLKWVNILSVPLAVTLTGLVIALIKRKRTSAK